MLIAKLYYMSGEIFKEIEYIDTNNLKEKLTYLLEEYIYDPEYIRLIFNNEILNNPEEHDINFYKINNFNLEDLQENNYISIILCEKKTLFFIENNNGKYEINPIYKCSWNQYGIISPLNINNKCSLDRYMILLNIIVHNYNDYYEIIINSLYKDIIIMAINKSNLVMENISRNMRNDEEILLAVIKSSVEGMRLIDHDTINYRNIAFEAIKLNADSIVYTPVYIKNDKEIVLEAVKQNGTILQHVSKSMKNDKDVVTLALNSKFYPGLTLGLAGRKIKKNKSIVLIAVKLNGLALKYANPKLRNDEEVVLEAIKQNRGALRFASQELKENDIIISAMKEL